MERIAHWFDHLSVAATEHLLLLAAVALSVRIIIGWIRQTLTSARTPLV